MAQSATKTARSAAKAGSATIESLKDKATKSLEKGVETAQDTAAELGNQAAEVAEQAKAEVRKQGEAGARFVRENPGMAVAGALGVGFLLGLTLRGRH